MGVPGPDVPRASTNGTVFELMAHPDQLEESAAALAASDPPSSSTLGHVQRRRNALWSAARRSPLGDNVHCKLSGLAMPLHSTDAR